MGKKDRTLQKRTDSTSIVKITNGTHGGSFKRFPWGGPHAKTLAGGLGCEDLRKGSRQLFDIRKGGGPTGNTQIEGSSKLAERKERTTGEPETKI